MGRISERCKNVALNKWMYLIDEGNEHHSLPLLLLAVEVGFEVDRIILNNGRVLTGH